MYLRLLHHMRYIYALADALEKETGVCADRWLSRSRIYSDDRQQADWLAKQLRKVNKDAWYRIGGAV